MSATSATRVSHHRLDPADTSKELKLQPLSRSQVLRLIPAGIFGAVVFGASAKPSFSALPTTEDYAFGTGSKVKRAKIAMIQDDLSAPPPPVNPNNLVEVVGAVSMELDRVQTLVQKERWGDALARLRGFPLKALKSPTLGLRSKGDVARSLGVSDSKASDILEASTEAGLTLREVEDIVFSNTRTLEFFNSADLEQMESLAKNGKPADLTEPLEIISDTKKLVDGVKDMIGAAASAQ
eukprot:jgi/Undpi1/6065/HiC_scaffold_20.g08550.m1